MMVQAEMKATRPIVAEAPLTHPAWGFTHSYGILPPKSKSQSPTILFRLPIIRLFPTILWAPIAYQNSGPSLHPA